MLIVSYSTLHISLTSANWCGSGSGSVSSLCINFVDPDRDFYLMRMRTQVTKMMRIRSGRGSGSTTLHLNNKKGFRWKHRYRRNNNYWRCLQNCSYIKYSTIGTILKWSHLHFNRFLWTSKPYSRAANKFYCFSTSSNCLEKYNTLDLELEQSTNRNQEYTQWTNRKQLQ